MAALAATFFSFCSFLATVYPLKGALALYALVAAVVFRLGRRMALIDMR